MNSPDKIVMAFAPCPTKVSYDILPRYSMRLQTIDLDESVVESIDASFLKYMEGQQFRLEGSLSAQKTIWMKPQVIAPQGFTIWAASNFRKVEVVSHTDFMIQNKGFH